jgi:hypothetical protein
MPNPQADRAIKSLQIELSTEVYDALIAKVQLSGCSASELVQQGLCFYLGLETSNPDPVESGWSELEIRMMQHLKIQIEAEIKMAIAAQINEMQKVVRDIQTDAIAQAAAIARIEAGLAQSHGIRTTEQQLISGAALAEKPEATSPPEIRQLQIGDIVQIRDPDSPHYMEHLCVSALGIIRATVTTEMGEQTFLKRDLRFVRSGSDEIA